MIQESENFGMNWPQFRLGVNRSLLEVDRDRIERMKMANCNSLGEFGRIQLKIGTGASRGSSLYIRTIGLEGFSAEGPDADSCPEPGIGLFSRRCLEPCWARLGQGLQEAERGDPTAGTLQMDSVRSA